MEPFDLDYFGVQLTVLPQTEGSFTKFCNTELIGTVIPTIEDEPLTVWISTVRRVSTALNGLLNEPESSDSITIKKSGYSLLPTSIFYLNMKKCYFLLGGVRRLFIIGQSIEPIHLEIGQ